MGKQPQRLADAISQLIHVRGLARARGREQLDQVWREIAGSAIAGRTRVTGIKRGVLHVAVSNAAMLNELVSFHRESLLREIKEQHASLGVRELKFRLQGT
jgi:predicted nucleic acid-binding Zn ribbon protein